MMSLSTTSRRGFDNAQIIKADSGRLEMTADKQHLYLHLYSGEQFENLKDQSVSRKNVPYRREVFREKHAIIEFDSEFNMADEGFMSNSEKSKDMWTLQSDVDSMVHRTDSLGRAYYREAKQGVYSANAKLDRQDTVRLAEASVTDYDVDSLYDVATLAEKEKFLSTAVNRAGSAGSDWNFKAFNIQKADENLRRHKAAWHEKLTLSLSCLIFFFIGAPLGGIIRKGGLGMPVVVSVIIFIIYYIINNTGFKMARDGKWIVWMGMWTSTAVLAPLGAFLTYKANKDSVVLNADAYVAWIKKILAFGVCVIFIARRSSSTIPIMSVCPGSFRHFLTVAVPMPDGIISNGCPIISVFGPIRPRTRRWRKSIPGWRVSSRRCPIPSHPV